VSVIGRGSFLYTGSESATPWLRAGREKRTGVRKKMGKGGRETE